MISRPVQQDGGADEAALDTNFAADHATPARFDSDSRLASDPYLAGRAIDIKWLAALLLLAATAILMLGTVWTSLRSGLSVAMAPVFRHATTAGDSQRADRLAPVKLPRDGDVIRARIEQLADDGHGTKPFTHVIARLAHVSGDPHASETPINKGFAGSASGGTLPPEIRFGASQPEPSAQASAFVSDESLPAPAPPGVPINLTVIAKAAGAVGAER